jgi:hypothetical protein
LQRSFWDDEFARCRYAAGVETGIARDIAGREPRTESPTNNRDSAELDAPVAHRSTTAKLRSEAFRRDALERERSVDEMNCGGSVNLQKLEEQLARGPVDEIAALMRALTYGEMIELAEGLWNVNGQGSEISKDNLPGLLHRWSTSRTA